MEDNNDFVKLCEIGSLESVIEAIKNGADVNAWGNTTDGYCSPLEAIFYRESEPTISADNCTLSMIEDNNANARSTIIKALIDAGADVNAKDTYGDTPLSSACIWGASPDEIRMLIKAGADLEAKGENGETPLMRAAFYSDLVVTRTFLEAGADVNARDNAGWTPLHCAVADLHCTQDVIMLLLKFGADPTVKNNKGELAMDYATTRPIKHWITQGIEDAKNQREP